MRSRVQRPTAALAATLLLATAVPTPATEGTVDPLRETAVVRAVRSVSPAVVNVYTETVVQEPIPFRSPFGRDPSFNRFLAPFFGPGAGPARTRRRSSLGSGLLIREDGLVVTNEHVVVGGSSIRVRLADNREFAAEVVGADSDSDLALLKLATDATLPFVAVGKDDSVMIGETVIAIGNPFGLSHTVTTGVLSAVGRTLETDAFAFHDFLQTDASINPGNSGGPLLDVRGRLLGINTAIHKSGEGIGFAIPIWKVRTVVADLLDRGTVRAAWIGVSVQEITPEIAFHLDIAPASGALVADVEADSPAERAGLRRGDVLTHVHGKAVTGAAAWAERTRGSAPGDKLRLAALRGGKALQFVVDVAALPDERVDALAWRALGIAAGEHRGPGVAITDVRPGSPAAKIGIRPGDAVTGLGGAAVEDLETFRKLTARLSGRGAVLLHVLRGRTVYRVTIPLESRTATP